MSKKKESTQGNSIRERQKAAWRMRAICLEHHFSNGNGSDFGVGGREDPRAVSKSPEPMFFNTVMEFYSILRPYLKAREDMEEYWKGVSIEGLGGDGLQELDEWRFKEKREGRTVDDPSTGTGSTVTTKPAYLPPKATANILDVLDEVAMELGFAAEAKEATQRTQIDKDTVEEADERAEELIKEARNEQ